MRAELIELLRCPASHEPTPLVTVAYARDGDHLRQGLLGCPVCGAEFALRDGIADLRLPVGDGKTTRTPAPSALERALRTAGAIPPDPARTAALLGLIDPAMRVALCGKYAALAPEIAVLAGVKCVAVNAGTLTMNDMVDCLQINGVSDFPIASSSLSGVALDDEHIQYLSDAPRIVRTGGRIVAPAHAIMPHGCEELARDSTEWVAVVTATPSMPITLRRGDVTSG